MNIDWMAGIEDREIKNLRENSSAWPENKAVVCVFTRFNATVLLFCANVCDRPTVAKRNVPQGTDWKQFARLGWVRESVNAELNDFESKPRPESNSSYRMGPKSEQWGYGKNL